MIVWIVHDNRLQTFVLTVDREERELFGSHFIFSKSDAGLLVHVGEIGVSYLLKDEEECSINDLKIRVFRYSKGWMKYHSYLYQNTISIGTVMNDINISCGMLKRNAIIIHRDTYTIHVDIGMEVYLNGESINGDTCFRFGDILETCYLRILFEKDFIYLNHAEQMWCSLNKFSVTTSVLPEIRFDKTLHRYQPDVIREYTIQVEEPQRLQSMEKRSMIFSIGPAVTMSLASLTGASFSIYRGYINGRELLDMIPMVILPFMMLLSTLLWNPLQRMYEKKVFQKRKQERMENYLQYLLQLQEQIKEYHQSYLMLSEYFLMHDGRIYKQDHPKCIYLPLGKTVGFIRFDLIRKFLWNKEDTVLKERFENIENNAKQLPALYILHLTVGSRVYINDHSMYLFCILRYFSAVYHPQDVLIGLLMERRIYEKNVWLKKIPHVYHRGIRCISDSMQQITMFSQGFGGIKILLNFMTFHIDHLPDWICFDSCCHPFTTHIIDFEDQKLTVRNHQSREIYTCVDYMQSIHADFVPMHNYYSKVNQTKQHSFLSLYDVLSVDELNIQQRWDRAKINDAIKIRIGRDSDDQIIYLDLHENGDGPHGLIAGTTGSGKSELITSLLLSLAISFSPEDLQMVLIDFKGGGSGSVLYLNDTALPHICGNLSNLDIEQMKRALHALKKICSDREKIFKRISEELGYPVINLHAYREVYQQINTYPKLAEVIIIVDEFAELKRERPDFLEELIVIARIGRSLGLHLILATQKPAGVVNDQIWANTSFRICMRVADRHDAIEVLHDAKAALLQKPGEFYLLNGSGLQYGKAGYAHAKSRSIRHVQLIDLQGNVECSTAVSRKQPSQVQEILHVIRKLHPQPVGQLWLNLLSLYPYKEDRFFSIGVIDDYIACRQYQLILDFRHQLSYLFVGKSHTERKNIVHLLLNRMHCEDKKIWLIDDLFCRQDKYEGICTLFHYDQTDKISAMFQSLQENPPCFLIITDLTLFLQKENYREQLFRLLEVNQKYHHRIFVLNQTSLNIPYRLLSLFAFKISLSNDQLQDIQTLFATTQKQIQRKEGYGLLMHQQNLLECSFYQVEKYDEEI